MCTHLRGALRQPAGRPKSLADSNGSKAFFRAAAEAMRQIFIDRARRRLRHGQNAQWVDIDAIDISLPEKEEILLQLDEALEELKAVSPERAEIVNLRFFAGLTESGQL